MGNQFYLVCMWTDKSAVFDDSWFIGYTLWLDEAQAYLVSVGFEKVSEYHYKKTVNIEDFDPDTKGQEEVNAFIEAITRIEKGKNWW